jgi:CRP-like cAMP-binding protein
MVQENDMRKALYLMGFLDDTDVEWLARHGSRRRLGKDEILIREGVPVDSLFIILDGCLTVRAGSHDIASLLAGEIVGEISFVDSRPPLATVVAVDTSLVLSIPKDALRARMDGDPSFASRFYRAVATFLADRLRMTTSRLGYSNADDDAVRDVADEIDVEMIEAVSMASARFERLQKQLRTEPPRPGE